MFAFDSASYSLRNVLLARIQLGRIRTTLGLGGIYDCDGFNFWNYRQLHN